MKIKLSSVQQQEPKQYANGSKTTNILSQIKKHINREPHTNQNKFTPNICVYLSS